MKWTQKVSLFILNYSIPNKEKLLSSCYVKIWEPRSTESKFYKQSEALPNKFDLQFRSRANSARTFLFWKKIFYLRIPFFFWRVCTKSKIPLWQSDNKKAKYFLFLSSSSLRILFIWRVLLFTSCVKMQIRLSFAVYVIVTLLFDSQMLFGCKS